MSRLAIAIVVAAVWAGCFIATESKFEEFCLGCMCWASTNCSYDHEHPCIQHDWGEVCGPFAINYNYWHDGGCRHVASGRNDDHDRIDKCDSKYYYECVADNDCNQLTVQAYLERFVTNLHPNAGCELYARTHSGGPSGTGASYATEYWHAVEECCTFTGDYLSQDDVCDTPGSLDFDTWE